MWKFVVPEDFRALWNVYRPLFAASTTKSDLPRPAAGKLLGRTQVGADFSDAAHRASAHLPVPLLRSLAVRGRQALRPLRLLLRERRLLCRERLEAQLLDLAPEPVFNQDGSKRSKVYETYAIIDDKNFLHSICVE